MFQWITDNLSTIIISAIVIAAVIIVVLKMIKDRKNGKSSCSCGCSGCPMSDACHKKDK